MEKHYSCNGKEIKRQYLNEEERNIYMSLAAIVNMIHGIKLQRDKYVQLENVIENWDRRDFITKEEKKSLKLANTYLKKFLDAVYERLDKRTKETLEKKLVSFGFRLLDQETLKIINRYNDLKENVVVDRKTFDSVAEDIANVYCCGCNCNYQDCKIYDMYTQMLYVGVGEKPNCPFACDLNDYKEDEQNIISHFKKDVAERTKVRKLSEKEVKELIGKVADKHARSQSSKQDDGIRKGIKENGKGKSKTSGTRGKEDRSSKQSKDKFSKRAGKTKNRKGSNSNNSGYSKR